jgi:bifunctional DNA-binding transcriptional regulator/antitoxin component of YhaV-PrlF toxin-antitoxin module
MTTMIRVSKHGRLTLPPTLCRKLGLDRLRASVVIVEERKGGLFLRPAPPIPASHRTELNRRLAALAKNREQGRPWTKVRDALRRR